MAYQARRDGFLPELRRTAQASARPEFFSADKETVLRTLNKGRLDLFDLGVLLSPEAGGCLESMALRAQAETVRRFGKTVQLFAPLYLANYCTNACVYCGFHTGSRIKRKMLTFAEVEEEAKALAATGLRRVLCLTGDAPGKTGPAYLAECVRILARHVPSVSIEAPALSAEEYAQAGLAGADGMTMFQETYAAVRYAELHPAGPKRDFLFRLDAPQRAAEGGMRGLTLGVLLGLSDWRFDALLLGAHLAWLSRTFPQAELSFSLPRIRPAAEASPAFTAAPVGDKDFVQAMLALRCFLPHVGITLSTRESAFMRDALVPLGVTRLSAGVRTSVGGYAAAARQPEAREDTPVFRPESTASIRRPVKEGRAGDPVQFIIDDERSVDETAAALAGMGYQPVFADWLLPEQGDLPLSKGLYRSLGSARVSGEMP